jgi:hypothetical protein
MATSKLDPLKIHLPSIDTLNSLNLNHHFFTCFLDLDSLWTIQLRLVSSEELLEARSVECNGRFGSAECFSLSPTWVLWRVLRRLPNEDGLIEGCFPGTRSPLDTTGCSIDLPSVALFSQAMLKFSAECFSFSLACVIWRLLADDSRDVSWSLVTNFVGTAGCSMDSSLVGLFSPAMLTSSAGISLLLSEILFPFSMQSAKTFSVDLSSIEPAV